MSETNQVVPILRLAAQRFGGVLWRNNSGALPNPTGRIVRFGLGHDSAEQAVRWKSSDLIGIAPGGRLWAVEAKREDWTWRGTKREVAQAAFHQNVRMFGGIAGFARNANDLLEMLACNIAWDQPNGAMLSWPPRGR
jgi:hypothetical protein